ncbi:RloB domain-containing protein [Rhodanobacter sp. 7MK24]|uniref:RloB domain-containing protein n=1 Tax=Rhodanobacter sp. 7MK24 TaxID=2775922 RepID=UPI00177AC05C|nr:RloB domain-containing protein [Rhodanobacter sp. 7MK24]MBD8881783.1 RloB domain-containing protein [Rhodanobacter sp. 7MK24]
MTPLQPAKTRTVRETLLIVCEGDAEIAFVRFVKRTYADALGRAVQWHSANGKGGKNVLEAGLRHAKNNRATDKLVLLLDTDKDWNDALRARARKARVGKHPVSVIEANPCLEAWLLQILGVETEGDTRHMKNKFEEHTGGEAHEPGWMERHLNRALLDKARARVSQLSELMNHMGIAKR